MTHQPAKAPQFHFNLSTIAPVGAYRTFCQYRNAMGNFYTNYTVRGAERSAIIEFMSGRQAIVSPTDQNCVVVFDEESDSQSPSVVEALGKSLSSELGCTVLTIVNHDDSILIYQLIQNGEVIDEYDSCPGYFDFSAAEIEGPSGGDAAKLCKAFGVDRREQIERVLRGGIDDYVFAFERHDQLIDALGISKFGVGTGFASFEDGELPDGLALNEVTRVM